MAEGERLFIEAKLQSGCNGVEICDLCGVCDLPTVCYEPVGADHRYSGFNVDGAVKRVVRLPEGFNGCRARALLSVNPKDAQGIESAKKITEEVRERLAERTRSSKTQST